MSKQLAAVRSNLKFHVNYSNAELMPEVELVILCWNPKYKSNKDEQIVIGSEIVESRFWLDSKGLNQLIAELKITAEKLLQYEQAGEALNSVIRTMKPDNK